MKEQLPPAVRPTSLEMLMNQHKQDFPALVKQMDQEFENCSDLAGVHKLQKLLAQYCNEMEAHMSLEERTITHIWLNLSAQQYKTYRTYLSWKYSVMY